MSEPFEHVYSADLQYRRGYRYAYVEDIPEPLVFGMHGPLQQYYPIEGQPVPSTLDHIIAAVGSCMHGTLTGALVGRKVEYDRKAFRARVEGHIVGTGSSDVHIKSIVVHYELSVPPEAREAAERALRFHLKGCWAHRSVAAAIDVSWDAELTVGGDVIHLVQEASDPH